MTDTTRPSDADGAKAAKDPEPDSESLWSRLTRFTKRTNHDTLDGELSAMLERNQEAAELMASDEGLIIQNVLSLRDLSAHDIMVPRADMVALDIDCERGEMLKAVIEQPHSRFPVFRESLDDIVGFVHIKDILACVAQDQPVVLSELMREILIVSPAILVMDLLLDMRIKRVHMAVVVDEFGGIDGLVTIEDLVEQIVGEIEDEHDQDEPVLLVHKADGSLLANARLPLEELEEQLEITLVDEEERAEIDTLGGLVFSLAGQVPSRGALIHHDAGVEFEVVDADPRRIKRVRVRLRKEIAGEE